MIYYHLNRLLYSCTSLTHLLPISGSYKTSLHIIIKYFNGLLILFLGGLSLLLQFGNLFVDVCIRREVDRHRHFQVLQGCVVP